MTKSRILILVFIFTLPVSSLSMEKYDDAEYHFSEKILKEYGEEFSIKQSYVHGGMYLKWALDNGLTGGESIEFFSQKLELLKSREIKGSELLEDMDGVLDSLCLNDEGQRFTKWYFGVEKNSYFEDFEKTLSKDLSDYLLVEDTWENFDLISKVISNRYEQWKNANQTSKKTPNNSAF